MYTELLQSQGKEFFLADTALYAPADGRPTTFAELAEAARERGEVAVGVQRADGAGGEPELTLNPPAGRKLTLTPGDRVVVLGELF